MAKIRNPVLFSKQFKVDPHVLESLGVFDPILNVDTRLSIDPLLLQSSRHAEININAWETYQKYFEKIIILLSLSKAEGDVPWRNVERIFSFSEIKGTCLGYGAATISGSGWGLFLRRQVLRTAKEVIDLGIKDPELFFVLALLEEGIGPDRISDMVTNIILKDLLSFNKRIIAQLNLTPLEFNINGLITQLLPNPLEVTHSPVILVPRDILRDLPIARDWDEVADVAWKNRVLRDKINLQVGEIWAVKTRKEKEEIKNKVVSSKVAFSSFLDIFHIIEKKPYDFIIDKNGEVVWTHFLCPQFSEKYPLTLSVDENPTLDSLFRVVNQIVQQFKKLIEDNGIWKELWVKNKPRNEKSAQRLFFAIADTYCKANGIDITPEADSGAGPIDFKFSFGYNFRVLVEIKLSRNPHLLAGYESQLEVYKSAERVLRAIYLVIDVGGMGEKSKKILELKNNIMAKGNMASEIIFVDGSKKLSASKRKSQ